MEKTTEGMEIEVDRDDEDEAATEIMRDRFRLCTISIAEAEARRNGMEISQPIMACISDLAFKYAEQVARDLELFAQHASRKSVNMEDVILCEIGEEKHHLPPSDGAKESSSETEDSLEAVMFSFNAPWDEISEKSLVEVKSSNLREVKFGNLQEEFSREAHRNNHFAVSLRSFCSDLKAKEPPADRKRRKRPRKETDVLYVPDK